MLASSLKGWSEDSRSHSQRERCVLALSSLVEACSYFTSDLGLSTQSWYLPHDLLTSSILPLKQPSRVLLSRVSTSLPPFSGGANSILRRFYLH